MDDRDANDLAALGHEPIETDVRAVWRTGAVMAGVVVATFLLIIGLMKWLAAAESRPAASYAASDDPKLKPNEQVLLPDLRGQEQEMLNEYEWVDQARGTARIPVGRAIEIISKGGLPVALQGSAATDSASGNQSTQPDNLPASVEGGER
jgi:hypothetical protein